MGQARRLFDSPIVHAGMLPGTDGDNINGPSLIVAPEWLPNRLGRFYLYFAHHGGRYIRLAYADDLAGPWTVHQPGTLRLEDAPACRGHIASPDVHVDQDAREIVMFFHGPIPNSKKQRTFIARSSDGLRFVAGSEDIAPFYFRTVRWGDNWLGMSWGGEAYVSSALRGPYERVAHSVFARASDGAGVRHVAVKVLGNRLQVFYSRIGDAPEQIGSATVDLSRPRNAWSATDIQPVLKPEREWEGANLPVTPSRSGAAHGREHALRDPAIFCWADRTYLLYSAAGESAIGIAELLE